MKLNNFRFGSLVAIVFILFFPLTANADDRHAQVDKIFAPWDKTSSPGCAVMIIKDGRIDYAHGYGMTHLEHGIPNSPQTIYRIGSTSKQFTAMCIAMLEARDQLSLEDDIRQYLPELRAYDTPIKIKHLIHHQSGLPDYLGLNRSFFYTPADSLKDLASVEKLLFLPGEKYQYSNSNYFLLSILVERITGSTLNQFATENIFQPLGMVHTHFHDDRNLIVPHRAQGYSPRRDGEGFRINITQFEHCGDGGIFTSLEDMYFWDQAFYHNNLGKELIERVQTPGLFNDGKKSNYAFGLTLGNYKGFRTVGHGGSFVGYKSVLLRFPEQKLTIVILANLSTMNPSRLARQIADLYLPRTQIYPEAEWLQVSSPEDFGYSSVKLLEAQEFIKTTQAAAYVIVVDGLVLHQWGEPPRKFNVHSIRKSFLSALYGIHVNNGNINLDLNMAQLGINDNEPSLTDVEKQATIRQLLQARSGIYHPALYETASMAAARPPRHSHEPGTFWYYNNWDFNTLGAIFRNLTLTDIFREFKLSIADPIGMQDFEYTDGSYVTGDDSVYPAYPFRMTARDMARFGLLFLRGGKWKDQQVIPADWITESTASYSDARGSGGYGYLWWVAANGRHLPGCTLEDGAYSARGAGGHYILVIPSHDMVIVQRVNTDPGTRHSVSSRQFGTFVQMILDAKLKTPFNY